MNNSSPLNLVTVNSSVEFYTPELSDYNSVLAFLNSHFKGNGFAVTYLDYKVLIGRYLNGLQFNAQEVFEPKYLQRLRLFNNTSELLVWKSGNTFMSRLRVDGLGETEDAVEAEQVLLGTRGEDCGDSWTRLTEERGTNYILPLDARHVNNKTRRAKLKTVNYISYNELGQAGYYDCRFVNLSIGGE